MSCLFITDTRHATNPYLDASTRYRCYNVVEELHKRNYISHVITLQNATPEILKAYDVAVFLRPSASKKLTFLVNACVRQNKTIIADYDDLLFSVEHASSSPAVQSGRSNLYRSIEKCQRHLDALPLFELFTVSTQALSDTLQLIKPDAKVHWMPNGLSSSWLQKNKLIIPLRQRKSTLLYLPGSHGHEKDYATIADFLPQLLNVNDRCAMKLNIIGPLVHKQLGLPQDMLEPGPQWVDFADLPIYLANATACLAPLADTSFNRHKSHIKFIEAAAFGTPVLASPQPDMQRHEVAGLFFSTHQDEWEQHLVELQQPDYYQHCSTELYSYARTECTAAAFVPALIDFYAASANSTPNINKSATDAPGFSIESATLITTANPLPRFLNRLRRKTQKLILSPRHFFLDSQLFIQFRKQLNRVRH